MQLLLNSKVLKLKEVLTTKKDRQLVTEKTNERRYLGDLRKKASIPNLSKNVDFELSKKKSQSDELS